MEQFPRPVVPFVAGRKYRKKDGKSSRLLRHKSLSGCCKCCENCVQPGTEISGAENILPEFLYSQQASMNEVKINWICVQG